MEHPDCRALAALFYVLSPGDKVDVSYQKVSDSGGRTLFAIDPQGLLACMLPEDGKGGRNGAFRMVGDTWNAA